MYTRSRAASAVSSLSSVQDNSSVKLDLWNLIQRPVTANPYQLTTRYRVKSAPNTRRARSGVISRRRRRPESRAESEGAESHQTNTTATDLTYFDFDKDFTEDFDFDGDDDTESRGRQSIMGSHSQVLYLRACRLLKVCPANAIVRHLVEERLNLRHQSLGPVGVKACCMALVENSSINSMDFSDNDIGQEGAGYIAETLAENTFITELAVADNSLGGDGLALLLKPIREMDIMTKVDFSGNKLQEYDAKLLAEYIESTQTLKELRLAHNLFRERGGMVLGDAIGWNETIEVLDLSWNHLRLNGAKAIAKGLAINSTLRVVDLSWNGFFLEGCKELVNTLTRNKTLEELDLTSNRINKQCLEELMKGLRKNTTLQVLKLAQNPITSVGAVAMLKFFVEMPSSGVNKLDFGEQSVEPEFMRLLESVENRPLEVKYGAVLTHDFGDDKDENKLLQANPIIILMEFAKLLGLRLMDLFAMMDKDNSKSLERHEIKSGLMDANIPLSEKAIDTLIQKLDKDGDGEIDYGELLSGYQEHRRKMFKQMQRMKESNANIEDTEVGAVRKGLKHLMDMQSKANRAKVKAVAISTFNENAKQAAEQREVAAAAAANKERSESLKPV